MIEKAHCDRCNEIQLKIDDAIMEMVYHINKSHDGEFD